MNSRRIKLNDLERIEEKLKAKAWKEALDLIKTELRDVESSKDFKEILENHHY